MCIITTIIIGIESSCMWGWFTLINTSLETRTFIITVWQANFTGSIMGQYVVVHASSSYTNTPFTCYWSYRSESGIELCSYATITIGVCDIDTNRIAIFDWFTTFASFGFIILFRTRSIWCSNLSDPSAAVYCHLSWSTSIWTTNTQWRYTAPTCCYSTCFQTYTYLHFTHHCNRIANTSIVH